MGLADRHYMRQPSASWRWTATLALIVALVVAFFLQYGPLKHISDEYLLLSLAGLKRGFVWQLLTFQFMHASPGHLAMNGVTLYLFGREMESVLGKTRFLTLYFASGVIGGLVQVLVGMIWPIYFGGSVLGASAGVFGIVAAFATLFPNQILTMFLIPIQFKARTLLYISGAVAIFGVVYPMTLGAHAIHAAHVADAAHLGGMLAGIAWIKLGWHHDYVQLPWEGWFSGRKSFKRQSRKSELIRATSIRVPRSRSAKSESSADVPEEEFISREVDPILDKISQHGIQSLTERERKILESARNKMAKR